MYKSVNGLFPPIFKDYYKTGAQLGGRQSRQSNDFIKPNYIKPKTQNNVKKMGVEIWYVYVRDTGMDIPIGGFKQYLVRTLLNKYTT